MFLPARDFAGGRGRIEAVAPGRLVARLELDGGLLAEATIDRAADGMPARVVDGEGVIALRVTDAQARLAVRARSISSPRPPCRSRRAPPAIASCSTAISSCRRCPARRRRSRSPASRVELGAHLPGALPAPPSFGAEPDRGAEIAALVANVRARITPDLGATPTSSRDADAATAGDCTTFALAYAALASRRGIPTRVVTGLRVDGDRLVRHRWAVSWTGRAWIAVDAAFGAVPAGGDLVGLAISDADDAGLVAGEAALTHVRGATWN